MKKFIYTTILVLSAVIVFASCSRESLDTAQYSDSEVTLASFGPNPVMRGATLSFYGSNLDQVTAVNVPGVDPITSIEVISAGKISEIRVQLPAENEVPGQVTLTTANGKTLTTQTELTYSEPIVFDSFSVEKKGSTAMPGDKITFKGDYMNLVQFVTFEGGEKVSVTSVDRYNAYAFIPNTAITGKVILSDGGTIENLLYSKEDLVIGKPTVKKLVCTSCKPDAGASITGEYLSMLSYITFEGGTVLDCSNLIISGDLTAISFTLPETARSGDVIATSYAGDEFVAGKLEMILPTELKAAPQPIKAGQTLTITGKDLDIVKGLDFPDYAGAAFTYSAQMKNITVPVPPAAQEGDIILSMANGDQVTVPYTLVQPTVTEITPVELYAGDNITVTGTDLDLVTGVTLGGKEVEFKADSDKQITVTTAKTSVSGKLVLTLANGETVEPETEIKLSYHSLIIVNSMPSAAHIGATVTFKGENFMQIENIFIGEAKVTTYTLRSDTEISFLMPYNSVGNYNVYFDLLNGSRETCPNSIEVQLELKYITAWEGNVTITWGDGGRVLIPAGKFMDVEAGARMRIYYSQKDQTWAQAQFNYGDWSGINFDAAGEGVVTFNQTLVPTDIYGWTFDSRCTEVILTQTILDNIQAKKGACESATDCGIIVQGSDLTFTKVEIVQEIPQEKTLWKGTADLGSWSVNWQVGDGTFGASNPNMFVDAGLTAGQEIRLYVTNQDWWQIQFFDGHWTAQTEIGVATGLNNGNNINAGIYTIKDGYIAIPVTETLKTQLTTLNDWGYCWIIQGEGLVINKITIF